MRQAIYIAILVLIAAAATAQPVLPKTQEAQNMAQSGDLKGASLKITEALRDAVEAKHPYAWYIKGYIHKRIYEEIEGESPTSENREMSVDALKTGLRLDTKKEYVTMIDKALVYFALTYYNDAIQLISNEDVALVERALASYARHKDLLRLTQPEFDFSSHDYEIYQRIAFLFTQLYHSDRDKYSEYYRSATDHYSIILELKPNDYMANYNTAINHYNTGTHRLSKVNYQTEIFELIVLQDECIRLFKLAMPFMLNAHAQNPERLETLKGLMAIHLALGEDDKSAYFKSEIERLVKEGKIKP